MIMSDNLSPPGDERVARVGWIRRLISRPELGALGGAVLVWLIFAFLAGDRGFLTPLGVASYLEVSSYLGILAVAIALLMIGGEFDLSIGSMIGAAGVMSAILAVVYGIPLWAAALVALLFALLVGLINGLLVIRTGLPSFIITLGSLFILRGLTIAFTRLATGRTQIGSLDEVSGYGPLHFLFGGSITLGGAHFSVSILWWLAITVLATWILLRTRFGNWIFGVGGNADAARNVGVPVARVKILLFMTTAAAAWLVAVIQLVTVKSVDTLRGTQQEFIAIIAAVIGGNLLTGGYGSAVGAALGALIFGMVRQGIVYAGIDADWFQVFLGAMLIVAVLVNQFIRRRAEKRQ